MVVSVVSVVCVLWLWQRPFGGVIPSLWYKYYETFSMVTPYGKSPEELDDVLIIYVKCGWRKGEGVG